MEDYHDSQATAMDSTAIADNGVGHGTIEDYPVMISAPDDAISTMSLEVNHSLDASAAQQIPLICSICPKNTKFSDVSHLLTHIASKGHLSNMFKLDIAKYTDEGARERLEEYQSWFDNHNIRELLQSRSENRIQKGSGARGRGGSHVSIASTSHRGGHGSSKSRNSTTRVKRRVRGDSQPTTHTASIKCELEDDLDSASDFNNPSNFYSQRPWNQSHGGQGWSNLPIWNGVYYEAGFQQGLNFGDGQHHVNREEDELKDVETSSRYEPSDMEDGGDSSFLLSEDTVDTTIHEQNQQPLHGALDDEEREHIHFRKYLKGEISRLEGVGGFDAAPEAQRRKRNQKKDPSVLVHMEASSRAVRTFEQVTDLNFNHIRWRDVYDEPSINGSEDEPDEPKLAKKAKRRSPKKPRGRLGRPRSVKVEENTSRDSSITSITRGSRRGRAARTTRQTSNRLTAPRNESPQVPNTTTISSRPIQSTINLGSNQGPPGHIRIGNRVVDVFRDNMDPLPGSSNNHVIERRQDGLPDLALRPGNVNLSLLSPTPMVKRHASSVRLLSGKLSSRGSFPEPPTTSNPYLSNPNSLGDRSFNPLCVQAQASRNVRGYSSWEEELKNINTGFQPINGQQGFDPLNMSSNDNEGYHTTQPRQGGIYDI